MIVLLVILAIISFGLLFWQASNIISVIFGSPYVMVDKKLICRALKLVGLKKGEIFYDLGCGNGDVLIEAAKIGAKVRGYEISPFFYLWARLRTAKYSNIKIDYQNIFKADLAKADVIYCYLWPKMLEKLAPKFKRELKSDSRLISIGFPIENLDQEKQFEINRHKIYIYPIL